MENGRGKFPLPFLLDSGQIKWLNDLLRKNMSFYAKNMLRYLQK